MLYWQKISDLDAENFNIPVYMALLEAEMILKNLKYAVQLL